MAGAAIAGIGLLAVQVAHASPAAPVMRVIAPDVRPGEDSALRLVIGVPQGAWLADSLSWVAGEAPDGISFGAAVLPVPHKRGDQTVHQGELTLALPVQATQQAPRGEHTVLTTLQWQLCTADGCASTLTQQLPLPVRVLAPLPAAESEPLPTR